MAKKDLRPGAPKENKAPKYSAPAVAKLLDIVELMAAEDRGFSVNELAKRLGNPVNTVYRICKEMESRGYLEKGADDGLYYLGGRFFTIGRIAGARIELRTRALPHMRALRDLTGETVHLTILREGRMVLLDQAETSQPIRIHVETGALMHPHASAFGKCLIAFSGLKSGTAPLPALTPSTITDPARLERELAKIRSCGVAFDEEEYMDGVRCVGAPVFGAGGKAVAALGVVAPAYRFMRETAQKAAGPVAAAARAVSVACGWQPGEAAK